MARMIFFKHYFHHLSQLKCVQCTLLQTDELLTIFPACLIHFHLGKLCLECGFLLKYLSASLNSLHPVGLSSSPNLHESSVTIHSDPSGPWMSLARNINFVHFLFSSLFKSCFPIWAVGFLSWDNRPLLQPVVHMQGRENQVLIPSQLLISLLPLALVVEDRLCQLDEYLPTTSGVPLLVYVTAVTCVMYPNHSSFWSTFPHPAISSQEYCRLWVTRSGVLFCISYSWCRNQLCNRNIQEPCFQPLSSAQVPPVFLVSSSGRHLVFL